MRIYPIFIDDEVPFLGFCVAQNELRARSYLRQRFPSLEEDSEILIQAPILLTYRTCFLVDMNLQVIEHEDGLTIWEGEEVPVEPILIEDKENKEDIIEGTFMEEKDDTYSWA